jgi:hypothetical protein
MASRSLFLAFVAAAAIASESSMPLPRYTQDNQLLRPQGYRDWMFAGANLGMGYVDGAPAKNPAFHNIYIQREAYRQYAATGAFPDKTMLVMEVVKPGTNASINKNGHFQDQLMGVEVALKDETRFPEKWAYFNFIKQGGGQLEQSKAFPKDACWKCHNEHGAADNVFVQFYPVLRDARGK